jgi:hypothetical protein
VLFGSAGLVLAMGAVSLGNDVVEDEDVRIESAISVEEGSR